MCSNISIQIDWLHFHIIWRWKKSLRQHARKYPTSHSTMLQHRLSTVYLKIFFNGSMLFMFSIFMLFDVRPFFSAPSIETTFISTRLDLGSSSSPRLFNFFHFISFSSCRSEMFFFRCLLYFFSVTDYRRAACSLSLLE